MDEASEASVNAPAAEGKTATFEPQPIRKSMTQKWSRSRAMLPRVKALARAGTGPGAGRLTQGASFMRESPRTGPGPSVAAPAP